VEAYGKKWTFWFSTLGFGGTAEDPSNRMFSSKSFGPCLNK